MYKRQPFGREAMKQGARSAMTIEQGESLKVTFGAFVHDERPFDPDAEFNVFSNADFP